MHAEISIPCLKGVQMLFRKSLSGLAIAVITCSATMAYGSQERPTMSLGYEQGHIRDFGDVRGGNFRFQYENAKPRGVMGSLTAMKNSWQDELSSCRQADKTCRESYRKKHNLDSKAEYYSVMAGPTYRLSENLSVFALGGISHSRVEFPARSVKPVSASDNTHGQSSSQYAYSTGITLNPADNLALTAGYEGSRASFDDKKHQLKSGFMDVGYRF